MNLSNSLWTLYQTLASVNSVVSQLCSPIFTWILLSLVSTLVFNLLSINGKDVKLEFSFLLERVIDTVILSGILTDFVVYRVNRNLVQVLTEKIAEPFETFPEESVKFKVVQKYKRRVTICGVTIFFIVSIAVVFEFCAPLAHALRGYNLGAKVQDLPLPIGRVPWFVDSIWLYALVYLVSATALLTSSLMYVCWFSMFFSSALQIETYLKLLILDIDHFEERTLDFCKDRMSLVNCQRLLKEPRLTVVEDSAIEYLRQVVGRHITIVNHVRTLENAYKWIILAFCKGGVLIAALSIMLIVDEWYLYSKMLPDRLNMLISTLFFLYVNSYAGQIIIDQSAKLSQALYNISWVDKTPRFQHNLYVMMTVCRRPLRLSAGTVFTLGMESYSTIMEAVYSYVNFLIHLMQLRTTPGTNV